MKKDEQQPQTKTEHWLKIWTIIRDIIVLILASDKITELIKKI